MKRAKVIIFAVSLLVVLGTVLLFGAQAAKADMPRPRCSEYVAEYTPLGDKYWVCIEYSLSYREY